MSTGYDFPGDDTGEPLTQAQRDRMAAFYARVFEKTFANEETRAQIKDVCGSLLRGGSGLLKRIIFYVGRGGDNNKSGIVKIIEEVLANKNGGGGGSPYKYATTADRSLVYNTTDVAAGAASRGPERARGALRQPGLQGGPTLKNAGFGESVSTS